MKIVNVIGGLGNQMFQYAFYHSLKKNDPREEVYIDLQHFNKYKLHNGFELDRVFGLQDYRVASKREISKVSYYMPHYLLSRIIRRILPARKSEYIEKDAYSFDNRVYGLKGDYYLEGYWQAAGYFNHCRNDLLELFNFQGIDKRNSMLSEKMRHENSVSIHVRRGDYLNAPMFKGICDIHYYERAINFLSQKSEDLVFYVFSNDIAWCKENLGSFLSEYPVEYINHNTGKDSYKDIYLMSSCKNMIIANSSFSWWAAYLNKHVSHSCIISPSEWVNGRDTCGIFQTEWIKI